MISIDRLRRLGGVSILVLSAVTAGAVFDRVSAPAYAVQQEEPRFSAAVPSGAPMSFADLIESVSPSVVTIQASVDPTELQGAPDMEGMPPQFREWLERQFGQRGQQPAQPRQSLGSGFFISADGHIVTNNHVVADASEITIGLADGESYPARVIGLDPQTDLALLKVDADVEFPFVSLNEDPHYRVGDWVVAVGNPFGLGGTATAGIISATGREIGNSTWNDFIQIDAPINRGNSGGPTFDLNGQVVGVNSQIFSPTGGNVGIGFAIPSDVAARIVDQLLDQGHVSRGWLGVSIQNVTPDIAAALGLDEPRGAIVSSIVSGGPAAAGGFEREDVVLQINGQEVDGSRDLTRRVAALAAGERVNFRILRDGRERSLRVELGDRPDDATLTELSSDTPAPAEVAYFGMRLAPLADEDRELRGIGEDAVGMVVDAVEPGSEAARKGVSTGDVVLEAGGTSVANAETLETLIADAREDGRTAILMLIESRGGQRYVALQLDESE
jgi:serine protease Do